MELQEGFYWIEYKGFKIVAERVIDDYGVDFWLRCGSRGTIYDKEVKLLSEQIKYEDYA